MFDDLNELLNGAPRRAIHTTRYSRHAVHRVESVAEHVYNAMIYASVIAHHLSGGYKIDQGLVLNKTLWHDTEEPAGLGDILRGVKHSSPELLRMLEALGEKFVSLVASRLQMHRIREYWSKSKDATIEGQIVRVADVLSVVAYLIEEHMLGNRTLGEVYNEVLEYLDRVEEKVEVPELQDLVRDVREHFREKVKPAPVCRCQTT